MRSYITKFHIHKSSEFTLEDTFEIELSTCEGVIEVKLDEALLWEQFYTNPQICKMLDREGCFILDFVFNMGGSEAFAETYFGIG